MPATDNSIYRVLIIEDNRDAADTLAEYLRLNGFQVLVSYTGPAGLDTALAEHPDVVLSDINLPGIDGFEVARRIGEQMPDRPLLIAITAKREEDLLKDAAAAGFDYFFLKPAHPIEIAGFLCEHAEIKRRSPSSSTAQDFCISCI